MPHQTLRFVNAAADAAGVRDADVVVLDTGWTPDAAGGAAPIPIRPALLAVLDTVDAFGDSVAGIDAWAAAGSLADAFAVEGVTWWLSSDQAGFASTRARTSSQPNPSSPRRS